MTRDYYLDANASASLRPRARAVLLRALEEGRYEGNASSVHRAGQQSRSVVDRARQSFERWALPRYRAEQKEVRTIFTSGGTESANSLIFGFIPPWNKGRGQIIVSDIEHPAVLEAALLLEQLGWTVDRVAPDNAGFVPAKAIKEKLRSDTEMVLLMAANNETGCVQPICDLARQIRSEGYRGLICSDFTQAAAKCELTIDDLFESGVDAVSLAAHKLGSLHGLGVLCINSYLHTQMGLCYEFAPLIRGGAQQQGFRAGTENVLATLCFETVCDELAQSGAAELKQLREVRDELWQRLSLALPELRRLTPLDPERGLANTLSLHVPGCRADDLVVALDLEGILLSSGSACSSGTQRASHVLQAMDLGAAAREVIRISFDWNAAALDIADIAQRFVCSIQRMCSVSGPLEGELR